MHFILLYLAAEYLLKRVDWLLQVRVWGKTRLYSMRMLGFEW
jgi:hypothetical protein